MLLTEERPRTWWVALLATWAVAGMLVLMHTAAVREYIGMLDDLGLAGGAEPTPLRQVLPARHADAQTWVRYVLEAREAGVARLRTTEIDNAPEGRDVHWSSGFAWLVRAAAEVQQAITADEWPHALERALLWFNASLLLILLIAVSAATARTAGAGAGALVALGMVGHKRFYEGFSPGYVDHHGMATVAVLGLLFGVSWMGAGWWRPAGGTPGPPRLLPTSPASARRGAILSAVSGAVGLWFSAATMVPVIALAGIAGVVLAWSQGRAARRDGAVFAPQLWRLWGRLGAGLSIACFLIEYAPAHLGLRLEVNHPFHALAWWGGGELVASVAEWRLAGSRMDLAIGRQLLLPLLAIAVVPVAILAGGVSVFMVQDPFVGEMRHHVAEGKTLLAAARQSGWASIAVDLSFSLVLAPALFAILRRPPGDRILLGTLFVATAGLTIMAGAEMRWWVTASAAQLALLLPTVAVLLPREPRWRWPVLIGIGSLLFVVPATLRIVREYSQNRRGSFAAGDLLQPMYRDIAATLRADQPDGEIVLLADPNTSAGVGYFGRIRTLGTLYWENTAGLRAAAEVFCARSDEDALALARTRRVTHVVIMDATNFVGEFFRLLHPGASESDIKQSFGARLVLRAETVPRWLQPIPYRPPAELEASVGRVRLFKVAPEQSDAERLFHAAVAQVVRGEPTAAERTIAAALPEVPEAERVSFLEQTGAEFYEQGADAAAARMFQRALAIESDAGIANSLAWILATTSDVQLRDGRLALQLVAPLLAEGGNDPTLLSTFAAACAEVGRFAEAVSAAERALALVQRSGDAPATSLLQRRLEQYRVNRPWRQ